MEFDRLADTLLHLVEHSDNPLLRVGTRQFAYYLESNLYDMGALHYLVDSIDKMAEVPYRWTMAAASLTFMYSILFRFCHNNGKNCIILFRLLYFSEQNTPFYPPALNPINHSLANR